MIIASNRKKCKLSLTIMAISLVLFGVLIALLFTVDRAPIGPEGEIVGLSSLNGPVAKVLLFREGFYRLSTIGGVLLLLEGAAFAVVGFSILIREKSFAAVPFSFYALAGLYVVTILLYFIFYKVGINLRPVILPGEAPEQSFPSSHILLAAVIGGSAVPMIEKLLSGKPHLRLVALTANACLCLFTVFCRILSGIHWLTDIFGSLLLGFALVMAFAALLCTHAAKTEA